MFRSLKGAFAGLALAACATPDRPAPAGAPPAAAEARRPVTILVSIDGFRPDYLRQGNSPRLDALAAGGVSAAMRPSFPSKTFPNHWTLVTGDRPDRHGIVANKMEDAARPGETFTMASDDPFWWNGVPPIWVEAEKAGIRSATMFWPGANVQWGGTRDPQWPHDVTGGTRAQDWQQFNQTMPEVQRVNAILDWLRRPADIRPRFLTLYFDAVDTAGHRFGPGDTRTGAAVADIDRAIGMLVDGLKTLDQPANLVIVADHGMATTSSERTIALDRIAPPADYRIVETGPYAALEPQPGREAALRQALSQPHPHMQCWPKDQIPARFHYGRNPRVPAWLCLAETGWVIADKAPTIPMTGGAHGYDNMAPEMAALFVAHGPAFKPAAVLPAFDNVDVYPLLARLIGLSPHPSDGTAATFDTVLLPAR